MERDEVIGTLDVIGGATDAIEEEAEEQLIAGEEDWLD